MNMQTDTADTPRTRRIQHAIKWSVYTLLIVNFGFYIFEDSERAVHTLHAGSTLLDWTSEFATTIDEAAWFILLFMFELETYVLEDETTSDWQGRIVHAARIFCYAMIMHTIYAFAVAVVSLQPTVAVENVDDLCALSNDDVSYVYNLKYTRIDAESCDRLSSESEFYWLGDDPVVSDLAGLELEQDLALADLIEASAWLLIVFAIEFVVRMQNRGVSGGAAIRSANVLQIILYLVLIGIAVYWATLSHWLYVWDEFLWIGGFAAIEMNLSEWRDELRSDKPPS